MALVRELEEGGKPFDTVRRKYGVGGAGILQKWARQYGRGDLGKVIRVEKPNEVDERDQMKRRIKALETALTVQQYHGTAWCRRPCVGPSRHLGVKGELESRPASLQPVGRSHFQMIFGRANHAVVQACRRRTHVCEPSREIGEEIVVE